MNISRQEAAVKVLASTALGLCARLGERGAVNTAIVDLSNTDLVLLESAMHELGHIFALSGTLELAKQQRATVATRLHIRGIQTGSVAGGHHELTAVAVECETLFLLASDFNVHLVAQEDIAHAVHKHLNAAPFSGVQNISDLVTARRKTARVQRLAHELRRAVHVYGEEMFPALLGWGYDWRRVAV